MIATANMTPAELSALLHFHADAGVEWMIEDAAIDRFVEFADAKAARGAATLSPRQDAPAVTRASPAPSAQAGASRQPPAPVSPSVAIPDAQAVAEARLAAEAARSLPELRTAMAAFNGCNLKNSARNLVFADGSPESGIMVIGPMPNADDDRDGVPFSGRHGQMLDRMLSAIGLQRAQILLTNVIAWRPPGNRVPSQRETDICRPFIERQIQLAEPRHILVLGNFAARCLFGGTETIHNIRGSWRDMTIGNMTVPALATLHPQDLVTAPANKRLVWEDLLLFQANLRSA